VPVDGVALLLQELSKRLHRPEFVDRKVTHPDQIIRIVGLVSGQDIREAGPHPRPCWWTRRYGAEVEVRWIMVEEHGEPPRTISPHPTSRDDAGQGDRLAVLLFQGEQTGPVSLGILGGR
jgi:hypothetical protein